MEQTMSDLRRFTRALRPIYLEDLGLVAALEMLTREVGQADNLRVEFHRTGSERRLSSEAELALYRMAQEALSNVTRHAQAVQASLSIAFKPDAVIMTISDNGRGFQVPASPAALAPSGHFGLLGLHERAELIGARLAIQSAPGRGTQVIVNMPTSPLTKSVRLQR
jgi:signal transduction histidine kinase